MPKIKLTANKALTLVANQKTDTAEVARYLSPLIDIKTIEKKHPHVWKVICSPDTSLSPVLRELCYQNRWDFALQDEHPCQKKLLMSDMDATILVGESIDDMAKAWGVYDEISAITEKAMRGEIDYRMALKARLALLKGLPKQEIIKLAENIPIADGAQALLKKLNQQGLYSCLISGGFHVFTNTVAKKLGFQQHLSNVLSYDDQQRLDGGWIGDLVTAEVKAATLMTLTEQKQLSLCESVAIGDGANDIPMLKKAGLGVAFYGKPAIRQVAQAEIHSGTIDHLLWFLSA